MFQVNNFKAVALLCGLVLVVTSGVSLAQTQTADDIIGEWAFTMEMGGQGILADVIFAKTASGKLTGTWISTRGEEELANVVFMNGLLTFDRSAAMGGEKIELSFEGTHKNGKIDGYLYADLGEILTTAVKKAPPIKLAGEWSMTMQLGQRGGGG